MLSNLNKQRHIHPFPARMAPEIAIKAIEGLVRGDVILDPMVGSGTVLHQASLMGIRSIGFDLDPLAVLISTVRTNRINIDKFNSYFNAILKEAKNTKLKQVNLPWIDEDQETTDFIKFWFAKKQINDLRKIAFVIHNYKRNFKNVEIDAIRIAFSRIIITKKIGASLAWDISHSRPHRKKEDNNYNVFSGFEESALRVCKNLMCQSVIDTKGQINLGDARTMNKIPDEFIDKIITSPPYLNAIDYMRGHKFSLVWLGYSIPELRKIRSLSVGAEKKAVLGLNSEKIDKIYNKVLKGGDLQMNQLGMIKRYIDDSILLMSEMARVLKKGKEAILVIGNSNLKGNNIRNSEFFMLAGKLAGLELSHQIEREIPITKRYLPIALNKSNSLSKRMKQEVVMTFVNSGRKSYI